jgi:hypothetical protein
MIKAGKKSVRVVQLRGSRPFVGDKFGKSLVQKMPADGHADDGDHSFHSVIVSHIDYY